MKKIIPLALLLTILLSPTVLSQPGHGGNSNIPPGLEDRIDDIRGKVKTAPYKLDLMGTEYTAGQEGKLWLQLLKNHQAINNATCYLDVYYPNNTLWMNDSLMTPAIGDNGIYYYDLNVPDRTGVYMSSATCIQPQQAFVDDFVDDSKVSEKHNIKIEDGLVKLRSYLSQQSVLTQSDFNLGIFNRTSADRDDNSGDLGIGYLNGTNLTGGSLTEGLVGYWRMDRNVIEGGTVKDYSGEGNDGTLYTGGNTVSEVTGIFSTDAFDFDGNNDYINLGNTLDFARTDSFSIVAWIKTTKSDSTYAGVIISKLQPSDHKGWLFDIFDGQLRFVLEEKYPGDGIKVKTDSSSYNDGNWHYVVATYDGSSSKSGLNIWVDGNDVSVSRTTLGSFDGTIQNSGDALIGHRDDASTHLYKDKMDEVQIYGQVLSQEEIQDLYFQGMNRKFNGTYIANKIDNPETIGWNKLEINASIPTDTSLTAQFEALDSEGMVQDTQYISVNDGVQNYTLTVQNSEDGRLKFNGTSTDVTKTWEVNDFEIYGSPTTGYIFSKPIVLGGDRWREFMSQYEENQGNTSFRVVEDYNTTLCDGLGDIKSCAGTTSDVKLYAKLTRNSTSLTSPQIDRWSATWEEDVGEELRGSGEMHISPPVTTESNTEKIAQEVWKRFYHLGTPPEMESTKYYCEDNKTMKVVKDMEYCEGGDCETLTLNHTKTCEYGCIEEVEGAARCGESSFMKNAIVGGIIIFVIFLIYVLWVKM